MTQIDNIVCESWRDFKGRIIPELFGEECFQRGTYFFRGQASADWKLAPSFDRVFRSLSIDDKLIAMDDLLRYFIKECEGLNVPQDVWADNIKVLALGQHYGLPTRLLDWSESPYIAAFFAFSDALSLQSRCEYVAIWALNTDFPHYENGVTLLNVPSIGNIRLRNQYGKFSLFNAAFNCLEDYVESLDDCYGILRKIMIRTVSARDALTDLDAMGINHTRIYPELVGAALAAKIKIILDRNLID